MRIPSALLRSLAVVLMVGAGYGEARASIIFDASGTFDSGATLGGSLTIDTATGVVDSSQMTLSGFAGVFSISSQSTEDAAAFGIHPASHNYDVALVNGSEEIQLVIVTTAAHLVGYVGSSLCGNADGFYNAGATNVYDVCSQFPTVAFSNVDSPNQITLGFNGTLTQESSTPEPGSLALLAAGLLFFVAWQIPNLRQGPRSLCESFTGSITRS